MQPTDKKNVRISLLIAAATVLLIAGIGGLGYRLYQLQASVLVEQRLDELSALGASQVAEIDEWIGERTGDVSVLAGSPSVARYLAAGPTGDPAAGAAALLDKVASTFDYDAVMLTDSMGVIKLVRPNLNAGYVEGRTLPADVTVALVDAARTRVSGVMVPPAMGMEMEPDDEHVLYFVAPVSEGPTRLLGGVVYAVRPERAELPRIISLKHLGGTGNTAVESLVVHGDGGAPMAVAADPSTFVGVAPVEGEEPRPDVALQASRGIASRAVEEDATGRSWLVTGVWSPKLGMGFVNRQPADLVTVLSRRTTLLGVGTASLAILALAALALALWRGARLNAVAGRREAEREKAELEKRLAESERLEFVGRLAGGVAHDFNNLLAVVIGHLELADSRVGEGEGLDDVRVARDAAVRAARIGRQLLGVGGRQVLERAPLDLRPHVARAAQTLRGVAPPGVEIESHAPETVALVHADAVEMERVILNLVMNAVEAVGDNGHVTLSAMDRVVPNGLKAVNGEIPRGRYVVLRVSDDGPGIPEDRRSKVFEPFFTTKRTGGGGGLGLASALGIVSQHGGFLTLSSERGEGAVFEVYLPALDGDHGRDGPVSGDEARVFEGDVEPWGAVAPREGAAAGSPDPEAAVLVVDDEAGVRSFVARALRARGYRVVKAESPAEAEAVWAEEGPVSLLISDVIMPGGTGLELLARLRSTQPSLPAVLMSGYTAGAALGGDERPFRCRFLAKPFSLDQLLAEVTRALEDDSGAEPPSPSDPDAESVSGADAALRA